MAIKSSFLLLLSTFGFHKTTISHARRDLFLCCGWSPREKLFLRSFLISNYENFTSIFLPGSRSNIPHDAIPELHTTTMEFLFSFFLAFHFAVCKMFAFLCPCTIAVVFKLCTAIVSRTFIPLRNHDWIISCLFFFVLLLPPLQIGRKKPVGELRPASERFFQA
jgi:hypothetical protein